MENQAYMTNRIRFYLLIVALILNQAAFAQHLDVEVWGEGNALFAGYCRTPGVIGCDLGKLAQTLELPAGALPKESTTRKLIFLANFRDLPGGDFRTKNPGFQSIQNGLLPNELVGYRALGALKYWDPALSSWGNPPHGIQIALFGGLEASAEVLNDFSKCAGQLICFSDGSFGIDGSTIFSAEGILGKPELVVDITNNNGILHTHLSFFLENQQGEIGGPVGAYLVEMQLISNARFFPSEPFLILFNAGLDETALAAALIALAGKPSDTDLDPPRPILPASIPGDVDLDSDVDRIDVALILLAAQNNEQVNPGNAMLDVNDDGVIDRTDASLAKDLCTLRLCNIPIIAPATVLNVAAVYDQNTGILNLNDIQVSNQHYRAQLQLQDENIFVLNAVQIDKPRYAIPVRYDIESGILEIPSVYTQGKNFKAALRNIGDDKFRLEQLTEIGGVFE
ncbi:dockerin type I domain-containing protein [Nitrosomonas sp.]|uniref:dockerin type I domain-containing protein n=1 Tax=Nitrosomonas sp. TaxID=42353 RepID=UPI00272EED6D|nr:dockerin type I domain-containing protein [Nitrosomonas sp.]